MRWLLPLLVACGGGSSPAPDAPVAVHYVLDFTFGTNGEALINTGASAVSAVNVVATASGLGMFAKADIGGYVCLTTASGKLSNGACTMTDLDASAYGTLAPDGGGLVAIDASGALVHFGPMPSLAPTPTFPAKGVFAQRLEGKPIADGKIVATDGGSRIARVDGIVDLATGISGGPFVVNSIAWDDVFFLAVGTAGDGHPFSFWDPQNGTVELHENRLDAAGVPTEAISISSDQCAEATTAGFQYVNGDGSQFADPDVFFPQLNISQLDVFSDHGGNVFNVVLLSAGQIHTFDAAGMDASTFDPLPTDGHAPAMFDAVIGTDNGFIVAGVSGSSVVMYHYVPQ